MKKETKIKTLDILIKSCDVIIILVLLFSGIILFIAGIMGIDNDIANNIMAIMSIIISILVFGLFIYYLLSLVNKNRILHNKKPLKIFKHKIKTDSIK